MIEFGASRGETMLSRLALLLLLAVPACAQKMHVKVIKHAVDGVPFTRVVPGFGLNNGNATANCTAYGSTANCAANSSGSSIYLPAHTVEGSLTRIQMLLLLPDGRRVGIYCNDHFGGFAQAHLHTCKNPEADDLDADFSGDKVKLKWVVGIDGKKTESQIYLIDRVFPPIAPKQP